MKGGFHDEPRFSFLKFSRLFDSLQNFEYEYKLVLIFVSK